MNGVRDVLGQRFDGMVKLECSVADPIKFGDAVFEAIEQEIANG